MNTDRAIRTADRTPGEETLARGSVRPAPQAWDINRDGFVGKPLRRRRLLAARATRSRAASQLRGSVRQQPDVPKNEEEFPDATSLAEAGASERDADATPDARMMVLAATFAYGPRRFHRRASPGRGSDEKPRKADAPLVPRVRPTGRVRRGASLVLNVVFFGFTLTAGAAVALPMIPVMFGYRTMVVVSGSMEPEIGTGDAVVIDKQAPGDVQVGDVITFQPFGAQELKTHRVMAIERIDGRIYFQTKGDANDTPDPDLADSRAVVGTVRMHVPEVGSFLLYSSHPRLRLVLIGLPALVLMLQQGAAFLRGRRRDPETGSAASAAEPRRGRRTQAITCSWLPIVVIAVAIARGAGVSPTVEPAWALSSDTTAVGDNTFTTAAQFGP
jgi:signal peptidase